MPYSRFTLDRALTGIKSAGYDFVAWGTTHKDGGAQIPVIADSAAPERAKELGKKCRDIGLEPILMFSGIYPEADHALEVLKARILQAEAAGIPQVLTFGHTRGGNRNSGSSASSSLAPWHATTV